MSVTKIITIICWVVAAVILSGLVVWFMTGTIFGFGSGKWGDWNFGLNFGINIESLTGSFEVDGTYNVETAGIDSIKIDWVAGEATVKPHSGNDIQITELAQRALRDDEKLQYKVDGNTLKIDFRQSGSGIRNMPQKRLEVLVPQALSDNLKTLSVDSVSGAVNIAAINATSLSSGTASGGINFTDVAASGMNAETVSGGINITNAAAPSLNAETASGAIRVSGAFGGAEFNCISGSITLENTIQNSVAKAETVSGSITLSGAFERVNTQTVSGGIAVTSTTVPASFKAETVSGGITVALPADAAISVNHSSVSGKLSSDIPITMEGKGAQFEISTVSGSAKIIALG